jgi:Rnl2 family RNA ligase
MDFVIYDKIDNNTKKWSKASVNIKKWAITEKIHGANFSFVYSNNEIKYAKRTGLIKPEEYFYNYQVILEENLPKINFIIENVKKICPEQKSIIIYGELFGGSYPDIKSNYKPIQKGVYYSPNIHFYAFDIYIIESDRQYYLDFEKSLEIFKNSGIIYAEPLAIYDELETALNYPIGFNSLIPKKFGLPELEINKAEGIVVKSMNDRYIVKIKISDFSEIAFKENIVSNDYYEIAESCITDNRYNNVVSKVGEGDKALIYKMFVKDILSEIDIKNKKVKSKIKKWIYNEIIKKY